MPHMTLDVHIAEQYALYLIIITILAGLMFLIRSNAHTLLIMPKIQLIVPTVPTILKYWGGVELAQLAVILSTRASI